MIFIFYYRKIKRIHDFTSLGTLYPRAGGLNHVKCVENNDRKPLLEDPISKEALGKIKIEVRQMGKSYKVIAKSESKYIVECLKCNSKFKVPSNVGKVAAKCPHCMYIHEIGHNERPYGTKKGISFEALTNIFYKNGDINVAAFYMGLFLICFMIVFAKTGFRFI